MIAISMGLSNDPMLRVVLRTAVFIAVGLAVFVGGAQLGLPDTMIMSVLKGALVGLIGVEISKRLGLLGRDDE